MNANKTNKWLTLVANLGAIAGIIFLSKSPDVITKGRFMQVRVSLTILLVLCFGCVSAVTDEVTSPSGTNLKIGNLVSPLLEEDSFAGVLLAADETGVIFHGTFGQIDRELNIDARPEHAFVIGSMTKAFTAVLILQLVEEGRIELGSPAVKYWPEFLDPSGGRITIDQLLRHQSGLQHWGAIDDFLNSQAAVEWKADELIKLYADQGLRFEPGAETAYSSIGYLVLGVVAEQVTGRSYAELLASRIFEPLGMDSSRLDDGVSLIPGRIDAYRFDFVSARYHRAESRHPSTTWSTGGIVATANDLARWAAALHGRHPNVVSDTIRQRVFDSQWGGQAYGWSVDVTENGTVASHGGLVTGYRSEIRLHLDTGTSVIALANLRDARSRDLTNAVARVLQGEKDVTLGRSILKETLKVSASQGATAANQRFDEVFDDPESSFETDEIDFLVAGIELRSDGACDRAAPIFEHWATRFPDHQYITIALANAADCRLLLGEREAAAELIARLETVNPEHPMLTELRARL